MKINSRAAQKLSYNVQDGSSYGICYTFLAYFPSSQRAWVTMLNK